MVALTDMPALDVTIIGAGAAGLFCAGVAGQLGLKVLVLDHSRKVAEKIRISGGGRCNFTNKNTTPANFLSNNPRFCKSALTRYTPQDFINLIHRHGIAHHEKHKGQLFCDRSAEDIIHMLLQECDAGGVKRWHGCAAQHIEYNGSLYSVGTDQGTVSSRFVVVATGGLSIPQIGASDYGYRIASQFQLPLIPPRPALVPLTFDTEVWQPFSALSGLSIPVQIQTGSKKSAIAFSEDLLFTHRGLSGPAGLQISSYWQAGTAIQIKLLPDTELYAHLLHAKLTSRKHLINELSCLLPTRLAQTWSQLSSPWSTQWQRPINEVSDKTLFALTESINHWQLTPAGTEGYRKAEVTAGGVDTQAISSQTMESNQRGLYFIGEVVDVTGWLGGYNFQWAWSSGFACAQAMAAKKATT
jgi:predicted Rossmann fold flavoprotein